MQGSVLAPFGESYLGLPTRGTPALEARTAWRHQIGEDRTLEIGGGAHYELPLSWNEQYLNIVSRRLAGPFVAVSNWVIFQTGSHLESRVVDGLTARIHSQALLMTRIRLFEP